MGLVLFILLLAVRSQAIDTQKGWSDWLSEGQAFRDAGDYSAAAHAFREALTIAERSSVSDAQLIALDDALAETYAEAGQFAESEAAYRRALDLSSQKAPNPHLMGAFLNDLAMLRLDQGRNEESIDLQQKSIRVLEAALGQEHSSLVVPFNNLATTYIKVGRFDEAGLTYQRAIDICRKTLGEDHLDYAVLLENYAVVLRKLAGNAKRRRPMRRGSRLSMPPIATMELA
jgi:tetratricopeptide (TPR) repeat protein